MLEPMSEPELWEEFSKMYPLDAAIIRASDRGADVAVEAIGANMKWAIFRTESHVVAAARDAAWQAHADALVAQAVAQEREACIAWVDASAAGLRARAQGGGSHG